MKTLHILLIAFASLAGCNKKADTQPVSRTDTTKTMMNDSITYLALGDSYTVGEAEPREQSYPYQLTDSLNGKGLRLHEPTVIATTGWTTDELINGIALSGITGKTYGFVTLLIGVNDQYRQLSLNDYSQKFTQVLHEAVAFAGGEADHVFVLSIPDWGVTPFANGQDAVIYPQIVAFNNVNQEICKSAGVSYLDVTTVSRTALNDPTMIAPDGLHFSGKMYALWTAMLEPMVAAKLKK